MSGSMSDAGRPGLGGWVGERLPVDPAKLTAGLNEPVPAHLKAYWYCLGGTPMFLLLVQVVTGILLTFHYRADGAQAYASVERITRDVPYGWWIRSIHHWAAHLMVLTVLLHMVRVFFTGAYRRPRELTWMVGCLILGVTLLMGFTGYSLIRDQNTYWGVNVASQITSQVPVVGEALRNLLLGGPENGDRTVSRLFVFHIGVLPTLLFLLLGVHLLLVRLHGVADVRRRETGVKTPTYPFFPDHVKTELILALTLTILLCALAVIFPAPLRAAADPTTTPAHVKPEWYLYFTFRTLKLMGLSAALLAMGAFSFLMFFWPVIDGRIRRKRPGSELSAWIGCGVVLLLVALTLWESFA
ncbi:MAG: cytochrome bc complex cytochrome b subunit [Planctomycetota bacterium]